MYGVGRMLLTGMVGDDVNALIKTGMLPNSVKYRLRKKRNAWQLNRLILQ